MDAKVLWNERLTFKGRADSGFEVPLGASPDVGGDDDGFRPMELMALAIAGCTAMDVISILMKKRQQVTGFEVRVHAEQAEDHPRVFTKVDIHYVIEGNDVKEAAVKRAIELSETKYCPAQAMFQKVLPITLSYEILEG